MIVITQPNATDEQIQRIVTRVREFGLEAQISRGASRVIIGVSGPETLLREKPIAAMAGVEAIVPVLKPYKLAARDSRGSSSVAIGNVRLGEHEDVVLICGPCSVESREQIQSIATIVKESGAKILRGGAFKPRTSPYSFQGLREEGLRFLAEARAKTGMPVVTEVMDPRDLSMIEKYADCLQVGTRNMHNFSLLKEVGRSRLPVLLKRGFSATIYDLMMSAEYILNEGNTNAVESAVLSGFFGARNLCAEDSAHYSRLVITRYNSARIWRKLCGAETSRYRASGTCRGERTHRTQTSRDTRCSLAGAVLTRHPSSPAICGCHNRAHVVSPSSR